MAENGKDIEAGKAKLEEEQRLRQAAEQAVKDRSAASEIAFYPHAGRSIVSLSNSCARTISLSLR